MKSKLIKVAHMLRDNPYKNIQYVLWVIDSIVDDLEKSEEAPSVAPSVAPGSFYTKYITKSK